MLLFFSLHANIIIFIVIVTVILLDVYGPLHCCFYVLYSMKYVVCLLYTIRGVC